KRGSTPAGLHGSPRGTAQKLRLLRRFRFAAIQRRCLTPAWPSASPAARPSGDLAACLPRPNGPCRLVPTPASPRLSPRRGAHARVRLTMQHIWSHVTTDTFRGARRGDRHGRVVGADPELPGPPVELARQGVATTPGRRGGGAQALGLSAALHVGEPGALPVARAGGAEGRRRGHAPDRRQDPDPEAVRGRPPRPPGARSGLPDARRALPEAAARRRPDRQGPDGDGSARRPARGGPGPALA